MAPRSLTENESNESSNIFHGQNFWVAQRVPMRFSIISTIKNHGGVVTPSEKNANILIADHTRGDVPPGSCSWKFVTDSVQHGIIQLIDHYRIGPDPQSPRPLGSERPRKKHRTGFTKEDDVALVRWVLSKPHQTGNQIYMEFEQMNPRHTWQSWRSRFSKSLMPLGQARLKQIANELSTESIAPVTGSNVTRDRGDTPETNLRERGPRRSASLPHNAESANPQTVANDRIVTQTPQPVPSQSCAVKTTQQECSLSPWCRDVDTAEELHDLRRQKFNTDLSIYLEESGIDLDSRTRVFRRVVDMWELHQAVIAQDKDAAWTNVAQHLGYDGAELQPAAEQLESLYRIVEQMSEAIYKFSQLDQRQQKGPELCQSPDLRNLSLLARSSALTRPRTESPRSKRPRDEEQQLSGSPVKRRRFSCVAETPLTAVTSDRLRHAHSSYQSSFPEDLQNKTIITHSHSSQSQLPVSAKSNGPAQKTLAMESEARHLPSLRSSSRHSTPKNQTPSRQLAPENHDAPTSSHELTPTPSKSGSLPLCAVPPTPDDVTLVSARKAKGKAARRLPSSFAQPTSPTAVRPEPSKSPDTPGTEKPGEEAKGTPPRPDPQDNLAQIRQVVESYEALKIPRRIVVEALRRTTLTPGGLATLVMENLMAGKSVPKYQEGVWTDRDDEGLRFVDVLTVGPFPLDARERARAEKERARLLHKHGLDRMQLRRRFLEAEEAFAF